MVISHLCRYGVYVTYPVYIYGVHQCTLEALLYILLIIVSMLIIGHPFLFLHLPPASAGL